MFTLGTRSHSVGRFAPSALQMTSHGLWLVTIAVKEYAKNILTKIVADEESGKVIHGEDVGRVVGRMKGEVGRVAWEMGLEDVRDGSNGAT